MSKRQQHTNHKPTAKTLTDIDISGIFKDEEMLENEASKEGSKKASFLNDNSHMKGKEGVDLEAGKSLTQEDIKNFTDPRTFNNDPDRDNQIVFVCKVCKFYTFDRPEEAKRGSYNFICPSCKEKGMAWGTKTSLQNLYKIKIASTADNPGQ